MSTEIKKEKEPEKEKCSFCGSEDHTLNGCLLFIASISCG